jgi:prepilin-type N-terminal cleavage/methylation domain-containing protein
MKNNGFTLIETMIYIALFGLIMSGAVVTAYQLLEGGRRNQAAISIQEEGTFLTRKINWALVGASEVNVIATTTLIITRPGLALYTPSQSPLTITASGTIMTLARGTVAPIPLHGDAFAVTNLEFSIEPATGGRPTSTIAHFFVNEKPFTLKTYLRR